MPSCYHCPINSPKNSYLSRDATVTRTRNVQIVSSQTHGAAKQMLRPKSLIIADWVRTRKKKFKRCKRSLMGLKDANRNTGTKSRSWKNNSMMWARAWLPTIFRHANIFISSFQWKAWVPKDAWPKHGQKPPSALLPNFPARNNSRASYSWGNNQVPPLPTLSTSYGSWENPGGTEYGRNYGGKGITQVPAAGSLGPNQSNHQPGLGTVASGSSQTALGYPPQQNGVGPTSLTNYSQIGRLQPDTLLRQGTAVNSYHERIHQPLDGQLDGMTHGLSTLQYGGFNPSLGQGLPHMPSLASQYPAPLQIQSLHNNQMDYYASPSPATVIAQGAHQIKTDSSYAYGNPQTEEIPSNLQRSAEDDELWGGNLYLNILVYLSCYLKRAFCNGFLCLSFILPRLYLYLLLWFLLYKLVLRS